MQLYFTLFFIDQDIKGGLLKQFSSKEKDVINVLDTMLIKTKKLRSNSNQNDQECIN